jgi:hypothetical protein
MNVLVEKKKEFTVHIINILSPLIFEGLTSIYNKANEISSGDNILKIFQSFLKRIPKWNDELLTQEINRIKTNSKDFELLYDLIRACIKANLYILTYSPINNNKVNINPEYYNSVNFSKFIHNIYIECAREVWNNPYLFYHNYTGIEIKRNQRDTIQLIKTCIEESIRKTLPLKHVLEIYLGNNFIEQVPDDNFEKTITEVDEKNLKQLLKQDLKDNDINQDINHDNVEDKGIVSINSNFLEQRNEYVNKSTGNNLHKSIKNSSSTSNVRIEPNSPINKDKKILNELSQLGGNNEVSASSKGLNSKILNILNDNNLELSNNDTSEKKIENRKLSETSSEELISNNMDNNLKKLIKNDLGNTDSESSTRFKPENTKNGYQEIFSNSHNENSINSQQKNDEVNKNKFFNNYLQF